MPEEKCLLLKEELDGIRRNRWITQILMVLLVLVLDWCFVMSIDWLVGLVLLVSFGIGISLLVSHYYDEEKENIKQQIAIMGFARKCSKCNWQISSRQIPGVYCTSCLLLWKAWREF
jgi:hypothetical protein